MDCANNRLHAHTVHWRMALILFFVAGVGGAHPLAWALTDGIRTYRNSRSLKLDIDPENKHASDFEGVSAVCRRSHPVELT